MKLWPQRTLHHVDVSFKDGSKEVHKFKTAERAQDHCKHLAGISKKAGIDYFCLDEKTNPMNSLAIFAVMAFALISTWVLEYFGVPGFIGY